MGRSTPECGSVFVANSPPDLLDRRWGLIFNSDSEISAIFLLLKECCGSSSILMIHALFGTDQVSIGLVDDQHGLEFFRIADLAKQTRLLAKKRPDFLFPTACRTSWATALRDLHGAA